MSPRRASYTSNHGKPKRVYVAAGSLGCAESNAAVSLLVSSPAGRRPIIAASRTRSGLTLMPGQSLVLALALTTAGLDWSSDLVTGSARQDGSPWLRTESRHFEIHCLPALLPERN